MKKLSLVIAVAAALPVLAHADVTISGMLATGFVSSNSSTTGFVRQSAIDDFGSKIRFTGSEDLGNGLKTVFKVENGFNSDGVPAAGSGSGILANRQTYVGLQTPSAGLFRIGYINDLLGETEATDNLGGGRREGVGLTPLYEEGFQPAPFTISGDGRAKNTLRWDSPDWNGFTALVQYAAGENAAAGKSATDYWGYRVGYHTQDSRWFTNLVQYAKTNMVEGKDGVDTRVEAGFNGDALSVAVSYGHQSMYGNTVGNAGYNALGISSAQSHLTGDAWAIYASYTIGAWKPQIVISQLKNASIDGKTVNTGQRQAAASVVYTLSKRTSFEAGYGIQNENSGAQSLAGDAKSSGNQTYIQMTHTF